MSPCRSWRNWNVSFLVISKFASQILSRCDGELSRSPPHTLSLLHASYTWYPTFAFSLLSLSCSLVSCYKCKQKLGGFRLFVRNDGVHLWMIVIYILIEWSYFHVTRILYYRSFIDTMSWQRRDSEGRKRSSLWLEVVDAIYISGWNFPHPSLDLWGQWTLFKRRWISPPHHPSMSAHSFLGRRNVTVYILNGVTYSSLRFEINEKQNKLRTCPRLFFRRL